MITLDDDAALVLFSGGTRDACRLRARGWAKFAQGLAEPRTSVVRYGT